MRAISPDTPDVGGVPEAPTPIGPASIPPPASGATT
jgi:hypothetical protein